MSDEPIIPDESEVPAWTDYTVDVDGATYTVLEPDSPDYHRIRTPAGLVTSCPGDSTQPLTAEALSAHLANPPARVPGVPQEVTRPRFIIALRKVLNITEGTVYAIISGLPAEQQEDVRDWFDHGVFFDRADPLLNAVAATQDITSEQLDAVFIHAGTKT